MSIQVLAIGTKTLRDTSKAVSVDSRGIEDAEEGRVS
jgi:hypothetical protein